MVGTNVGSVHKQRQGTGLATVLKGDMAVEDFIRLDNAGDNARQAAAQARRAAADAAMKDIKDFNPERWLRHDREIKDGLNQWIDEGARLLQSGVNPSASLDPKSVEWRKRKAMLEQTAKSSMQMKDMFEKTRAKLDGSEPDKYDQATILKMKEYFETPLDKITKEGILPPPMIQAKPGLNLQKTWAGLTKDLYDRNGSKPLDEAGKWDFVTASMSNDPEVIEATESYLFNLPQAEQDRYKQRAQQTGKSVMELVNYDFLERYSPGKEPFDLNKYIQTGADSIDVPYAEWRTPFKSGLAPDKKELGKIAATKAQTMLVNPEALYGYQSLLPMNDGESEGDYRARATADLTKRLQDLKATKTASGVTAEGQGEADIAASGEKWLQHLKSGSRDLEERASNFLFDARGVLGNMNVTAAAVDPELKYDDQAKKALPTLVMTVEGAPSLKEVKEGLRTNMGLPAETVDGAEYETVGTKTTIRIPISDNTENALLRIHDKAYKTGGRPYDPDPLQWSADELLKQNAPAQGGSKKIKYNG